MVSALLLSAALLSPAPLPAVRGDLPWPEYRGPARDGHAPAHCDPPSRWSETRNVAWKTAVHGKGWSSPVVGEGRVWLTTATEDGTELSLVALDLEDGRVVHDRVVFEVEDPAPWRNKMNSYASPSPVLAEGRVFLHFGTYGTACVDTETYAVVWERRDLLCDHMEGPGSSPILFEDRLIFNVDGGDVQYVIALDAHDGRTLWRTPRSVELASLAPDLRKAYGTPVVVRVGGRDELISTGARGTMAYDPRTGTELWRVEHPGFSMSSRTVVQGDLVFVNTGYMKAQLWALRAGPLEAAEGAEPPDRVVWKATRGIPTIPSPVLVDGRIVLVSDGGVALCLDAADGKQIWRHRLDGEYAASPLVAKDRIYFFNREGTATVISAGERFQRLEENRLRDGFMASPAAVDGALILRTKTHVYRVEEP